MNDATLSQIRLYAGTYRTPSAEDVARAQAGTAIHTALEAALGAAK